MIPGAHEHFENGFRICVINTWNTPDFVRALQNISPENFQNSQILQRGRHCVFRAKVAFQAEFREVVIKTYGKQSFWRDYYAKRGKGSKAFRAFETACHLQAKGVGTPTPIAVVERWEGNRLRESHLVCEFIPGLSDLRIELTRMLTRDRDCARLMELLECVARAIRQFHDAGIIHRDLGNQNIGLTRKADGSWNVFFVDLNRAQKFTKLTEKQRGKDLSRLDIPSGIFNEFLCVYRASAICREAEKKARTLFSIHAILRPIRHPIREYKLRKIDGQPFFYNFFDQQRLRRNLWIWDERSAQAISAYDAQDRRKMRPPGNLFAILREGLFRGIFLYAAFRKFDRTSFSESRDFEQAIGISLDANPETWEAQLTWLAELQGDSPLPILLRIYHHKPFSLCEWTLTRARELHARGHAIAFALTQSRDAVTRPDSWNALLAEVFNKTHDFADFYEVGHATNRGKWGIWDFRDYSRLLAPAIEAKKRFPHIKLTGPACIDFDMHTLPPLLAKAPKGLFYALSQHLYVDRRGAPENFQGKFDTVKKCVFHRAVTHVYKTKVRTEKIIVSEVNWPLLHTGAWAPVGMLFSNDGPWDSPPSTTEEKYAHYMCRYLLLTLASGHVSRVYWWRLAARGYGLIDDTGTPEKWRARPAFFALKALLSTLSNARFERRLSDVPEGTFALEFSRKDGSRFVLRWTADSGIEYGDIT